jgi:hypothetical protein
MNVITHLFIVTVEAKMCATCSLTIVELLSIMRRNDICRQTAVDRGPHLPIVRF